MAKQKDDDRAPAEWVAVDDLVPWDRNPRINDPAVAAVADSIRRYGFGAPIVARLADRTIIAGHTRVKAARTLGLDRVPVRFLDVTVEQAHELALVDNKTGEIAMWDDEALSAIVRDCDIDLAALGWTPAELATIEQRAQAAMRAAEGVLVDGLDFGAEWAGMPEFHQDSLSAHRVVSFHFRSAAAVATFERETGLSLPPDVRRVWVPPEEPVELVHEDDAEAVK